MTRDENSLRRSVCKKLTSTSRLLDESSYILTSHKATTIRTLTRQAQLVCNTTDSLSDMNKYLDRVFFKNNFNDNFIWPNTHQPTATTERNYTATLTTTATITYIKNVVYNFNCSNRSSLLHRRDWQKRKSPKSSSSKKFREQAVCLFPMPLGLILELQLRFVNKLMRVKVDRRWTALTGFIISERIYSLTLTWKTEGTIMLNSNGKA